MPYNPSSFKNLYFAYIATAVLAMGVVFVAAVVGGLLDARAQSAGQAPSGASVLAMLVAVPFLIAMAVVYCMLLYRMWAQIQDGPVRTTPGKAVGFMFIPFFNLYWVFVAFWGLSKDLNAYMGERSIQAPRVAEGLALTSCILMACAIIPCLGSIAALANLVIMLIVLWQMVTASKAIAESGSASAIGV